MKKYTFVLLVFFTFINYGFCQPNFIYEGGNGSKTSSYNHNHPSKYLYNGGYGAGYTLSIGTETGQNIFNGGDGSKKLSFENVEPITYLYEGSEEDGYAAVYNMEPFIWTGGIGTGWTVPGNWNHNAVPTISRRTIIPAGVSNYPYINMGVFTIGENPNNGLYKSGELWIQDGALLVTRVNCKIENYGLIVIDGEMQIRNTSSDAFINNTGANLQITSTGLLKFQ